jgi:HK97 family phage prohead protease
MESNQFSFASQVGGTPYGTTSQVILAPIIGRAQDPNLIHYRYGPNFIKLDADDKWIIEGYASTDAVDSYNEIVDPESMRRFMPRFLEFPITLLNHAWFEVPVGKIIEAEIRPKGLFVRSDISKSAPGIWQLIHEGNLRAFSIGFRGMTYQKPDPDKPGSPGIWREIELVEISIVNVPANREALFSVAAAKGISLTEFTRSSIQPTITKKGAGNIMPEITLQDVKGIVSTEVNALLPSLINAAVTQGVNAAMTENMRKSAETSGDINRRLSEMAQTIGNCATKAETQAMLDKTQVDASALMAKLERINAPGLGDPRDMVPRIADYTIEGFEKSLADEQNMPVQYIRSILYTPKQMTSNPNLQELVARYQEAHDNMHMLHVLFSASQKASYQGPKSLKYWRTTFKPLQDALRKAMDTATAGEGLEWIPTGFSASLMEKLELELVVANKFPSFAMPTNPFKWPFASSFPIAYKQGEATGDSETKYKASTPGTAAITFTAEKIAVRVLSSDELSEDSAVAMLPWLTGRVAKSIAGGKDNCILNGDTAGTQDSDFGDPADVRLCWDGLRKLALAASGSKADTAATTIADLLAVPKLMGNYAAKPSDVHIFMNIREYLTALADTAVAPVSAYGPQATILTGGLPVVYGFGLSVSEYQKNTLNASGVYDGTTMTKSSIIAAHKPSFMLGDRRAIRVETGGNIETGQDIIVATYRGDFANMQPSQTYPTAIGYDAS